MQLLVVLQCNKKYFDEKCGRYYKKNSRSFQDEYTIGFRAYKVLVIIGAWYNLYNVEGVA